MHNSKQYGEQFKKEIKKLGLTPGKVVQSLCRIPGFEKCGRSTIVNWCEGRGSITRSQLALKILKQHEGLLNLRVKAPLITASLPFALLASTESPKKLPDFGGVTVKLLLPGEGDECDKSSDLVVSRESQISGFRKLCTLCETRYARLDQCGGANGQVGGYITGRNYDECFRPSDIQIPIKKGVDITVLKQVQFLDYLIGDQEDLGKKRDALLALGYSASPAGSGPISERWVSAGIHRITWNLFVNIGDLKISFVQLLRLIQVVNDRLKASRNEQNVQDLFIPKFQILASKILHYSPCLSVDDEGLRLIFPDFARTGSSKSSPLQS